MGESLEVSSKDGIHLYGISVKNEHLDVLTFSMIHLILIYTLSFECWYCK